MANRLWMLGAAALAVYPAMPLHAQSQLPAFEEAPRQIGADSWRLTWKSRSGARYRLERSFDLKTWSPVDTVTALGPSSALVDDGAAGHDKVFWRVALLEEGAAGNGLRLTDVSRNPDNPDQWRLTWTSEAGVVYRLERSFDLRKWEPVGSVTGLPDFTSMIDREVAGQPMVFWRVAVDGGGAGLVVGDLMLNGVAVNGAASGLNLELLVGGSETVTEVIIYDGETELGAAQPGFGSSWHFVLNWDATAPQPHEFVAEVRTQEGSAERTAAQSLLLADPARFVPLSPEGQPLYGSFVAVDESGTLGAFLYHPEAPELSGRGTGAYFEFPAGASVQPPSPPAGATIAFAEGGFHRGPAGVSPPATVSGGPRFLDIDSLTPGEVAQAFELGAGPVDLDWGSGTVAWESGALGTGGWAGLQVELPIGEFALPIGRSNATLGQDPETGERFLIVTYHGNWEPLAGGARFSIPQADPLTIYLAENGNVEAHGTAEATFPNGAVVRGSIAWRYPNFEFRFEGKGIVIPALDILRQILPADPLVAAPSGSSTAELDEFAAQLEGYRDAMHGVAAGGVSQADPARADAFAPLSNPSDQMGSAMQAWAGRIASWSGDRAGQTLTPAEAEDLTRVVRQATRTAEGAHDLPTVLILLKHTLVTSRNIAPALGGGPTADALQSALADAEVRIFAAAERIIAARPEFAETTEFFEIVDLLGALKPLAIPPIAPASAPPAAGDGPDGADPPPASVDQRFRRMVAAMRLRMNLQKTFEGEFNNLSADELLASLQTLVVILRQLQADDTARTPADAPPEFPITTTNLIINAAFIARHDIDTSRALEDGRIGLLRDLLSDRASFFAFNARLGKIFNSNSLFQVSTRDLIELYVNKFRALPFSEVPVSCHSDWSWVEVLKIGTLDGGADSDVNFAFNAISQCDDLVATALAQANGANTCDELRQALLDQRMVSGVFFEPFRSRRDCRNPGPNRVKEGDAFMDITGSYEAEVLVEGPTDRPSKETFVTMQINQAGRYFEGNLQIVEFRVDHTDSYRRSTRRFKIDGLFTSQSEFGPGTAFGEMAIRIRESMEDATPPTSFALGNAVRTAADGHDMLFLSPAPMIGQAALVFDRTSPKPTLPASILGAFNPADRSGIEASQSSPLHRVLLSRLASDVLTLNDRIAEYYSNTVPTFGGQERTIADNITRIIAHIRTRLTPDQYPLAITYMKHTLSMQVPLDVKAVKLTRNESDLGTVTRTRWDLLLAVASDRHMNDLLDLLSLTSEQIAALVGTDNYQYHVELATHQATAGELLLTFGAFEFEMLVTRTHGTEVASFPLMGGFATWSPSVSPLPFSCAIGSIERNFSSPYPLEAADFAGLMLLVQVGGALALPGDAPNAFQALLELEIAGFNLLVPEEFKIPPGSNAVSLGMIQLKGSDRFPGLIIPLTGFADNDCFQVGVGLDIGPGWLKAFDGNPREGGESLVFEPGQELPFDFTARPHLESGVFFETNEFTLSPCGVQFLREFVAENRALFTGERSRIEVKGYTDTQGSALSNQTLSENRANAVKCVLEDLLGSALKAPIDAQGLGEGPAAAALGQVPDDPGAPPEGTDAPLFRRADVIVGGHIVGSIQAR